MLEIDNVWDKAKIVGVNISRKMLEWNEVPPTSLKVLHQDERLRRTWM